LVLMELKIMAIDGKLGRKNEPRTHRCIIIAA
jgi:hypothetical protein